MLAMARRGRIPGTVALGVLFIACGARTPWDWDYGQGGAAGTTPLGSTGGTGSPAAGGRGGTGWASPSTGSGGSGPSTTTGGAGGSAATGGCSLTPYRGEGACVDCIIDNCCTEYDLCADTCVGEFECLQSAVNYLYEENGTVTRWEQNEALSACREDPDDTRIVALFVCLANNDACATYCLGGH